MIGKILSMCFSIASVLSQNVIVHGNCSDGPKAPFEVWGYKRDSLICSLGKTANCKGNLPSKFQGESLESPESLTVEGVLIPCISSSCSLQPQMVVSWQPPSSASSVEKIKGFNIEIRQLKGRRGYVPDFLCRVFDFSENKFTARDSELWFRKKEAGYPGGDEFLFRLDVFTLPRSPESVPRSKYFKLQSVQVPSVTSTWSAALSYSGEGLTAPAEIPVMFSLAPESYGFKRYRVQLVDDPLGFNAFISCDVDPWNGYRCQERNYLRQEKNVTSVSHKFYDVPPGNYTIWIQPIDPRWRNESGCLCYSGLTSTGDKRKCYNCATTHTGEIIVGGKVEVVKHTLQSDKSWKKTTGLPLTANATKEDNASSRHNVPKGDNPVVIISALILVSVCGVIMTTILAVVIWRCKHRDFSGKKNTLLSSSEDGRKTVYLLYVDDHREHVNVVAKFADFLKVRCNCQVFYLPWYRGTIQVTGCYEWITSHIDKADYVIIINSEAAYNLFHARNTRMSLCMESLGPEGDTFSPAIAHVRTKSGHEDFFKRTILTYFEYTSEQFVLNELSPGIQYKLPTHLLELLSHIHEVDISKRAYKSMTNLQATAEGRNLREAIIKAKHFQKSDCSWFQKRFQRRDSAYVSVSSSDLRSYQENVDSVSTNYIDCPEVQFSFVDNEDAKSAFTYDTNYAITHPENRFNPIPPSEAVTASTEYINMQLLNINLQSMENEVCVHHVPDTVCPNSGYIALHQLDQDVFYPPSDL